ncbi:MAG TPA: hypothetical protein VIS03_18315 [Kiloniellaceae bacterium]
MSTLSLALGALVLGLAACSPYVYREEIASFGSGVDTSVAAFTAMTPAYAAWATEQRDGELLAFARNGDKPLTEGCDDLELRYEEAFEAAGAPAGDLLTPEDYAACRVTPVPVNDPDKGLPNLEGLGQALKDYAAALFVLTDAEDEAALEQAFGQLNASATSLLATVNEELAARSEPPLESAGALVYQAGLTYLRQRRFDALKQAVNANDAVVATAADLLAEAALYIYSPTLGEKKDALETAENRSAEVTAETYVAVWSDLNTARDAYVAALRASPIYAFFKIETTHRALRDSVNDPANRAQLEALYGNTLALKKAAEAALKAVRKEDGSSS